MRGQQALFDVRVFNQNANRYLNKALPQCYIQNEKEKKQQCNDRVLEIDDRKFTTLIFSILRGMGREGSTFNDRLAKNIAEKRELHQSIATNWIQTKIYLTLLKLGLLCLM